MSNRISISLIVLAATCLPAAAQEPGWASEVLLPRNVQQQVGAMPIVHRPYRPLHFYGNTIRRVHYRGRVLPTVNDIQRSGQHLFRRTYVPAGRFVR